MPKSTGEALMGERVVVGVGRRVRIEGVGCEILFRGRTATLLGYTRAGWARVRLDDASAWEASISADRDERTGLPIVLLFPDCLRTEDEPGP
jgi:hypothetical protein